MCSAVEIAPGHVGESNLLLSGGGSGPRVLVHTKKMQALLPQIAPDIMCIYTIAMCFFILPTLPPKGCDAENNILVANGILYTCALLFFLVVFVNHEEMVAQITIAACVFHFTVSLCLSLGAMGSLIIVPDTCAKGGAGMFMGIFLCNLVSMILSGASFVVQVAC